MPANTNGIDSAALIGAAEGLPRTETLCAIASAPWKIDAVRAIRHRSGRRNDAANGPDTAAREAVADPRPVSRSALRAKPGKAAPQGSRLSLAGLLLLQSFDDLVLDQAELARGREVVVHQNHERQHVT